MIIMLQPEQVSLFWPAIKHSITIANRLSKVAQQQFCNKVLERILTGKAQCWFGKFERDGKELISAVGITTIEESSLGEKYLFLHTLYAFRPIPEDHLHEMVPALELFASTVGCNKLVTFTSSPRLREYYREQGFTQDTTLWIKETV